LLLEVVEEVEALRELDVPHEGMGEAEADLLEVQVAQGTCHLLGI
jgi:hypothetical protein